MSPLEQATQRLEFQLDTLKMARTAFKLKMAEKKHLEHRLIRDAQGLGNSMRVSMSEKTTVAYASDEWGVFSLELANLEDKYEHECLKYEVLKADYQTKYLLHKESEEQIRKYR